jgi:hypothetical protein
MPYSGDHDRIQVPSLNADGSLTQQHPELLNVERFGTGTFGHETQFAELNKRFLQQEAAVTGDALTALRANHDVVRVALFEGQ